MIYEKRTGVPSFVSFEYRKKLKNYVVLIPIINEGIRIRQELIRAKNNNISEFADIVICDGGSTDGSTDEENLRTLDVNTLLVKKDSGKQGAQLRMGFWWALERGYEGIITIDGNNKDSIEDVPRFIEKLKEGFDFVQGSRFVKGGCAKNTPIARWLAVRIIHAPIISLTSHHRFTDTTNAYRGYSVRYLTDNRVQPFRDIFQTYELLAYMSVRATQIGLEACEIPVKREYPKKEKIPTKISLFSGNAELLKILLKNVRGDYNPVRKSPRIHARL
ncbi:MAG: glycosyltransferase family 2 protein [Dorea sp.]|nr:glycosyltransferase family 2 protein [Dorea sp.]